MKNFLSCIVFLFLLNSCSTDSDVPTASDSAVIDGKLNNGSVIPENLANHMDYVGKNYDVVLTQYSQQKDFPNSIQEMRDQIRFITKKDGVLKQTGKSAIVFTDEIVEAIMNDPDNNMIEIVDNSSLCTAVKTSLITFLQSLIIQRTQEFTVSYAFIVSYENTIIADTAISTEEKDTLLTVASISRYSLYSESARRDRDWETSVASKHAKPFFAKNETAIIMIIALLHGII
nr:hypothetical protein [uncultured Flavobacterium sp.]